MQVAQFACTLPQPSAAQFAATGFAASGRRAASAPKFGMLDGGLVTGPLAVCGCGCLGMAAIGGGLLAWFGGGLIKSVISGIKRLFESIAGFIDKTTLGKATADAAKK